MHKYLLFLAFLACLSPLFGQKSTPPTHSIFVSGTVKQEKTIALADLARFPDEKIRDVVITNHLGERKGVARKLRGVPVATLLADLELAEDNPKLFSRYYLVFEASDGYKVVFSWNEIFNAPTGRHTYLVTHKDGQPADQLEESMLLITPGDFKTGRRYIKNLAKITVARAE